MGNYSFSDGTTDFCGWYPETKGRVTTSRPFHFVFCLLFRILPLTRPVFTSQGMIFPKRTSPILARKNVHPGQQFRLPFSPVQDERESWRQQWRYRDRYPLIGGVQEAGREDQTLTRLCCVNALLADLQPTPCTRTRDDQSPAQMSGSRVER